MPERHDKGNLGWRTGHNHNCLSLGLSCTHLWCFSTAWYGSLYV